MPLPFTFTNSFRQTETSILLQCFDGTYRPEFLQVIKNIVFLRHFYPPLRNFVTTDTHERHRTPPSSRTISCASHGRYNRTFYSDTLVSNRLSIKDFPHSPGYIHGYDRDLCEFIHPVLGVRTVFFGDLAITRAIGRPRFRASVL